MNSSPIRSVRQVKVRGLFFFSRTEQRCAFPAKGRKLQKALEGEMRCGHYMTWWQLQPLERANTTSVVALAERRIHSELLCFAVLVCVCIYIDGFFECVFTLNTCNAVYMTGTGRSVLSPPKSAGNKITIANESETNKQINKQKRSSEMHRRINTHKTEECIHACEQTLAKIQTRTQKPIPLCKGCGVRTPWVVRMRMISTQYDVVGQTLWRKMLTGCF